MAFWFKGQSTRRTRTPKAISSQPYATPRDSCPASKMFVTRMETHRMMGRKMAHPYGLASSMSCPIAARRRCSRGPRKTLY